MKGVPSIPRDLLFAQPVTTLRSMAESLNPSKSRPIHARSCKIGDTYGIVLDGFRLPSLANGRQWKEKAAHSQLCAVLIAEAVCRWPRPKLGPRDRVVVSIVRRGPVRLDGDNGRASAKYVQDAVARWVGIDDGDPRFASGVTTEEGPYSVEVRVSLVVGERSLVGQSTAPSSEVQDEVFAQGGAVLAFDFSGDVVMLCDAPGVKAMVATGAVRRWVVVKSREAIVSERAP